MIFLTFLILHLSAPIQQTTVFGTYQPTLRVGNVQKAYAVIQAGVPDDGAPELQPALGYGVTQ